jgi:Ras GTPase-activating-like protein IQGAP2/3
MNRYSVNAVYSMAAEQDVEVEDDLARSEFRSYGLFLVS